MSAFNKAKRIIIKILFLLVISDLILISSYVILSDYYISKYSINNRTQDAAFIFFEGLGEYDGVSWGSYQRVMQAKHLYDSNMVRNIACLGGAIGDDKLRGAVLMCDILKRAGIPEQAIHVDNNSWDTITNWQEAERMIKEKGWKGVTLVSSSSHILRILYIASKSEVAISLSPYSRDLNFSWSSIKRALDETHHEFIAWSAMILLPDNVYSRLMKNYRLG